MKEAKQILREDKRLLEILVEEAKTNDKKVMVYPFDKVISSKGQIAFIKEWHVMREGNKTSRKFDSKSDAVTFAGKISKKISGKVHISG